MDPQRNTNATLVDLLDRVLDKGVVIHADLIVSVAGIPLIGVNLRAALAGMETMLKYGIMQAWDERIRTWELDYESKKKSCLVQGEEIILKMLGAYYSSQGIYTTWKYGYLYLTNERLLLYHEGFGEVLFETPLVKITALAIRKGEHFTPLESSATLSSHTGPVRDRRSYGAGSNGPGEPCSYIGKQRGEILTGFTERKEREELYMLLEGNKTARLTALDVDELKKAIEKKMEEMGLVLEKDPALPVFEERAAEFLIEGEQVICSGKMWYLMEADGIIEETWSPGYLYLTDKRLCWWYNFERRIVIEMPVSGIIGSVMGTRARSEVLEKEKVLDVLYAVNGTRRVASFSGDALEEWHRTVKQIISGQSISLVEDETESCPQCERTASIKTLLEQGCARCGWVSPKKKVVSGQLSIVS